MGQGNERNILKKGSFITLCEYLNKNNKSKFQIISSVKDVKTGGSAVCYMASKNGEVGRLKEFYPCDNEKGNEYYSLARDKENQIYCDLDSEANKENFKKACDEFVRTYEELQNAKNKNGNSILNNFLPSSVLYKGAGSKESHGSVYVFTKDDKIGETFEEYIKNIHSSPQKSPVSKLYYIVETLKTVTDFIISLHGADLLHLDLKPSNFLVTYTSQFEINPSSISVFDINSICKMGATPVFAGTPGFNAPELSGKIDSNDFSKKTITLRCDYYSIGAIFYYALFNTKYENKKEETNFEAELSQCPFIENSSCNGDPTLKSQIAKFLRKSLAFYSKDRYNSASTLYQDLVDIQSRLLSYSYNENNAEKNTKLLLIDKDYRENVDPTTVIQNLLYRYPLYQNEKAGKNGEQIIINAVTVGAGDYAQRFIDQALQCGQMVGRYLRIFAISNDSENNKAQYLSTRNELADFVNIDGENADDNMYADLNFKNLNINSKNSKDDIKNCIDDALESVNINYFFVALGDLNENEKIAKKLASVYPDACVVFVAQKSTNIKTSQNLVPAYIDEKVILSDISPRLEQMAFNLHMIWDSDVNVGINEKRKEFKKDRYNYESSVASALSIKYKLHSVNIELDENDLCKTCREFEENIEEYKNDLLYLEHRRWCIEKLCQGWKCKKVEDCKNSPHNDKKRKMHTCLIKSDKEIKLSKTSSYWKSDDIDNLQLDDLDKMSLKLHKLYNEIAKEKAQDRNIISKSANEIGNLIASSKNSCLAFSELYSCIESIIHQNAAKISIYNSYKKSFVKTLAEFSVEIKTQVINRLGEIESFLQPFKNALEKVDYKKIDEDLIENIPYILTGNENRNIVVPFAWGSVENDFSNIFSSMFICPKNIYYISYVQSVSDMEKLNVSIDNTIRLINRKNILSKLNFLVFYKIENNSEEFNAVREKISNKFKNTRNTTRFENIDENYNVIYSVIAYFNDNNIKIDAFELKANGVGYLFSDSEIRKKYPTFSFDSKNQVFNISDERCAFLKYLKKKTLYITVDDIFGADMSQGTRYDVPRFKDEYKSLWDYYSKGNNSEIWKNLCRILAADAEKNDWLVTFNAVSQNDFNDCFEYYMPYYAAQGIEKVLDALKKYNVIKDNKCEFNNGITYKVSFKSSSSSYRPFFNKLFFNAETFIDKDSLSVFASGDSVYVKRDKLVTKDIDFSELKGYSELLNLLEQKHLIVKWRKIKDGNVYSISYSSTAAKHLLTTEGNLFEIYVYQSLLNSGAFDDITNSYEISWNGSDIKNEFDIIATKGFKTYFIEIKSVNNLKQEYGYKIKSLTERFGVNATPVIIAYTYQNDINEIEKMREKQLGVLTITDKTVIAGIARKFFEEVDNF